MPAATDQEWAAGLQLFASRGMPFVVVQDHVPGDLVKFYGVNGAGRPDGWFDWFYHRNQTLSGHPLDPARLKQTALAAATALGVEIFGGDAIVGADGSLKVIDLNAWPSFALRRAVAAEAIAHHLTERFEHRLPGVLMSSEL